MDTIMEETGMLVVDPPEELVIKGPFDRATCKKIMVFNPSKTTRVTFKLKTTSPRIFFVRPNVGMILPQHSIKIDIFVHPMGLEQIGQRHKFLMQAAEANANIKDLLGFWKTLSPKSIWDTKIKVKMIGAENADAGRNSPLTLTEGQAMEEGDQDKENNDPMAKLLQQVNEIEEDREYLKQKLDAVEKEKEELTVSMMKQQGKKTGTFGLYFGLVLVCSMLAACLYNAYYV